MVTQFHTLLHFVTLICTILSPTACVAASIRIQGVSKSHLLSIYAHIHTLMRIAQAIAAGPTHSNQFTMVSMVTSALVLAPSPWALRHFTLDPDSNNQPELVGSRTNVSLCAEIFETMYLADALSVA